MNVATCVPCHGSPKFAFMASYAALIHYSAGSIAGAIHQEGSNLPENRNALVSLAIEHGAEKLLWLDADMTFPRDGLERLLAHNHPLVGTNYRRRGPSGFPVAMGLDGQLLWTTKESAGLAPVKATGLGFFLMDVSVLLRMITPWFSTGTEDHYFFTKAMAVGFTPMIDHDLSKEIGHIGETVLKFED